MQILLLNPPFKTEYGKFSRDQRSPAITKSGTLYYPVWLAYATGILEKFGYNAKLVDSCAELLSFEKTLALIQTYKPNVVVLNTSTPSIWSDIKFAEKVKCHLPNCFIICVGTHPSALPEETMALSNAIDVIARREYDYTILEIVKALGNNKEISNILGITYRDKNTGKCLSNPDRPLIENLDELPFAAEVYKRHLNINNYFFAAAEYPMVMIFTGRGCPNNCFFCVYPQVFHGRDSYRLRSPENVVAEFEYILTNFPEVKAIGIEDDTFTADISRARQICNLLIEKGINKKISWWVNARVNLDYATMKLMKEAGCNLLIAGFESGNQTVLNGMHKGISLEQSKEYVENAKKAGLRIHGCFMVGNPGETKQTMEETLAMALQLNTDTAQFFPLMVYPGTEAFEWARKNNLLTTEDYSQWVTEEGLHNCVICTKDQTNKELVKFCDQARRKYYLRPQYIITKIIQSMGNSNERKRILKSAKRFVKFLIKRG